MSRAVVCAKPLSYRQRLAPSRSFSRFPMAPLSCYTNVLYKRPKQLNTPGMTNVEISQRAGLVPAPARSLEYRRAVLTFIGSYAVIEVLAALCSILVVAITHTNFSGNHADVHNHAFVTSERFYPLINLASWMTFAAVYFRKPARRWSRTGEAVRLGGFLARTRSSL